MLRDEAHSYIFGGGKDYDSLLFNAKTQLAKSFAQRGVGKEALLEGSKEWAGWMGNADLQKIWIDAINQGYAEVAVKPPKAVVDFQNDSIIKDAMRKQLLSGALAGASRAQAVAHLTRAAQEHYPEVDYPLLEAMAEGVVDQELASLVGATPRPK